MMALESRVVLTLLLLSGGIMLALAAMVEQPDESHEPAAAGAVAADPTAHEPEAEAAAGENDEHADEAAEAAGSTETAHGGESGVGEEEHEEAADPAHADESDSFLGVDLAELNLAAPRLALVVIGLTALLAVGLAVWRSVGPLAATVGLGLAALAVCLYEAAQAGEELGIFVPLPVLAAVLYGGAAGLAGLAIVGSRAESAATGHE